MNVTRILLVVVILLLEAFSAHAAGNEPGSLLTVEQAVRRAVERNPDVRIERYNPAISDAEYRKTFAIYNPLATILTQYSDAKTVTALSPQTDRQDVTINAGVTQLISTGATIGLGVNNNYTNIDSATSSGYSNYWQSTLNVDFKQPLLKNFGSEATELGITVARNAKSVTFEQFRTRLMESILSVISQYYQVVSLRDDLEVKKTSLALARKILQNTEGQVKAGVLPAMEILNAEFGVATREKDIIDAEKALADKKDAVAYLLALESPFEVSTADSLPVKLLEIQDEAALRTALERRPEIRGQAVTVQTNEVQERVARNRKLPDLSLAAGATLLGLRDQYSRTMKDVSSADHPSWSIGLQLTYPLGNDDAANEYIRTRLQTEQAKVRLKNLQDSIANEVKTGVRGVTASFKQLEVAERGKAYAEERFKAFQKKNEVGLATTKDLLDVENDLAVARSNQIKARVDYATSLVTYWKSTGELLEREGIVVDELEAEKMVGALR